MRGRALLVVLAMAVATVALAATAIAGSPNDRATGGGQILFSTDPGAGNTIAFTAQGTSEDAKGQVQFIDRSAGTGQSQVKKHGVVDCLFVEGNSARIYGHNRDDASDTFQLFVMDNGEPNQGNDLVAFNDEPEGSCGNRDDDDDGNTALARGNSQVYDAP
jgi:hypothetical protein